MVRAVVLVVDCWHSPSPSLPQSCNSAASTACVSEFAIGSRKVRAPTPGLRAFRCATPAPLRYHAPLDNNGHQQEEKCCTALARANLIHLPGTACAPRSWLLV